MSPTVEFKNLLSNQHNENCFDVTCEEVLQNIENIQLIDVRTPKEFKGELGHINGASLQVLDQLEESLKTLNKEITTVFVCRSGGRSTKATLLAKEIGFKDCFNMQGGMLAWNERGYEISRG